MSDILRLYPPPAETVKEIYGELELPTESKNGDPSKPFVYINMVSSLDGKASIDGKSGGIGSSVDRETMRILRSKADAVMVGAGSLRAEKVSLTSEGRRSPEPLAVILSGSGKLPLEENLIGAEKDRTVVLLPESTSAEKRDYLSRYARILASKSSKPGHKYLAGAIRLLKQHFEVRRLLVEGGPSLNHSLISNGLADELFLTLSPKLIGGYPEEISTILQGSHLPQENVLTSILSIHLAEDELFLRYALSAPVSDK